MSDFSFDFSAEESNPDSIGLLDKKGTYAVDCIAIGSKEDQVEMSFKVVAAVEPECQDQVGREFKQWISHPNSVPENRRTATVNTIIRIWIAFGNYSEEQWKADRELKKPIRPDLSQCLGKRAIFAMKMVNDKDDPSKVKYRNIEKSARTDDPLYVKFAAKFASIQLSELKKMESESDDSDWG